MESIPAIFDNIKGTMIDFYEALKIKPYIIVLLL